MNTIWILYRADNMLICMYHFLYRLYLFLRFICSLFVVHLLPDNRRSVGLFTYFTCFLLVFFCLICIFLCYLSCICPPTIGGVWTWSSVWQLDKCQILSTKSIALSFLLVFYTWTMFFLLLLYKTVVPLNQVNLPLLLLVFHTWLIFCYVFLL